VKGKLKRVASFTIIELVMALLISSVVITMVYYSYLLFNNQFSGYQAKSVAMRGYLLLQKSLQIDLEKAEAIESLSESQILFRDGLTGQTTEYDFSKNAIVRTLDQTRDSFHVKNNGFSSIPISDSNPLIGKIVLKVKVGDVSFDAVFQKQYSALEIMKQEQSNE
jgi:type II secretory pathway pseudopilin PulG